MSKTRKTYQIEVISSNGAFPGTAEGLVSAGIPLKIARRWQKVRRQMTTDLARRVRKDVN